MVFDSDPGDCIKVVKYLTSKGYAEKEVAKMTGLSAKEVRAIIANLPKPKKGPKK
jgi:transposase